MELQFLNIEYITNQWLIINYDFKIVKYLKFEIWLKVLEYR